MNSRERVRMALSGQVPDRIPKALAFYPLSPRAIAPQDAESYFGLDVCFTRFEPALEQKDFLTYLRELPKDVHVGNLDQLRTYHTWGYRPETGDASPLASSHTIDALAARKLPNFTQPDQYRSLCQQVDGGHARGLAVAGAPPHLGGEIFEAAWRLRGFGNFMIDLRERHSLATYLLDQLTALTIENVCLLAEAGIDVLLLDDDIAMPTGLLISLETWRTFFAPRLASIISEARRAAPDLLIFYHSDGNFTDILPDLVSLGVNVVNPIQPDCMDAEAIRQEFGSRLALWGTVGTAWLWDRGTPEQIQAEVQRRIETLGPAGLLLSPAYDIGFTPLANLSAFTEAVDRYGRLA